jgi:Ni/Co efflux regulator RcnB
MKTVKILLGIAVVASMAASCKRGCTDPTALNYDPKAKKESKKDDKQCIYPEPVDSTTIKITSNITTNTTWETGKTYVLATRIAVIKEQP